MRPGYFLVRARRDFAAHAAKSWKGWAVNFLWAAIPLTVAQVGGAYLPDGNPLKSAAEQRLPLMGVGGVAILSLAGIFLWHVWRAPSRIVDEQRRKRQMAQKTARSYIASNITYREAHDQQAAEWQGKLQGVLEERRTDSEQFSRRMTEEVDRRAAVVEERDALKTQVSDLLAQLKAKDDLINRRRSSAIDTAIALEATLRDRVREAVTIIQRIHGVERSVGTTVVLISPRQTAQSWFQNVRNDLFGSDYQGLLAPERHGPGMAGSGFDFPLDDEELHPWIESKVETIREICDRLREDVVQLRSKEPDGEVQR
jgi:hypothetical protein